MVVCGGEFGGELARASLRVCRALRFLKKDLIKMIVESIIES